MVDRKNIISIHGCAMAADGQIVPPIDEHSYFVRDNIVASCKEYASEVVIDKIPQQPLSGLPFKWLGWVLHKYKTCLLVQDGAQDGTYQPDGNWSIEYAMRYKLIFLDAYKRVAGIDLIAEHFGEVTKHAAYLRYAYMGDGNTTEKTRYFSDETMLDSYQINAFGALYLRMASLLQDPYLQWAGLTNPAAGKLFPSGAKVKGGPVFIYACGFLDYLWYDPKVKAEFVPPQETAKIFADGELAVLRTKFGDGLTVAYQGRRGNTMYASPNLVVNKNGVAMLCQAPDKGSLPVAEANCPAGGGGDMERKGVIRQFEAGKNESSVCIDGFLLKQKICVQHSKPTRIDIQLRTVKHPPKEVRFMVQDEKHFVRLRGEGYLQYAREHNLNPNEGMLELSFRLSKPPQRKWNKPMVLFSCGQHLHYMFGDAVFFGFLEDGHLGVKFKDREGRWLFAQVSNVLPEIVPMVWYKAVVYWKNFNMPNRQPVCGLAIESNITEARLAMPEGKPFSFAPNTTMWVGGGVQMPESFAQADIEYVKLYKKCSFKEGIPKPEEKNLSFWADYAQGKEAVFAKGLCQELAGGNMEYRLHVEKREGSGAAIEDGRVRVWRDGQEIWVRSSGEGASFTLEDMPYVRTGFAGDSFEKVEDDPVYQKIIIKPQGNKKELHFVLEDM